MPTFREDIKLGTKVPMIKADDINDGAVTSVKIRDGNVTTEKLADKNVTTDKLADKSVTAAKIIEKAVTNEKLSDRSVTVDKVADNSISTPKLQDASITTVKIAPESITTSKIANASITNEKIAVGSINASKLTSDVKSLIAAASGMSDELLESLGNVSARMDYLQKQVNTNKDDISSNQRRILDNKSEQSEKNASLDSDIAKLESRSTQMEDSIKNIAISGGASTASAVTYNNKESQLSAVNIQSAVDELQTKKINRSDIIVLGEDEYNTIEKDSSKIYFVYEEEE